MANIFNEEVSPTQRTNMHDLATINQLNVEGFLARAEKLRGEGRHVLVSYDGAAITGLESFSSSEEAFEELNKRKTLASQSEHFKMLLPAHDGVPAHDLDITGEASYAKPPGGSVLGADDEQQMIELADARDTAERALCEAARNYTVAQAKCTVFANDLRQRVQADHAQGNLFN